MRNIKEIELRIEVVRVARDLADHLGLITKSFDLMIEVLEWALEEANT